PARLTPSERSMVAPYRWEAVAAITLFERGREVAGIEFERPSERALFWLLPYLPRRTANTLVAPIVDAAEASLLPAREFAQRRHEFEVARPDAADWLVNTAGSWLARSTPDFLSYVQRLHDLDALIVLAQVARRAHDE